MQLRASHAAATVAPETQPHARTHTHTAVASTNTMNSIAHRTNRKMCAAACECALICSLQGPMGLIPHA